MTLNWGKKILILYLGFVGIIVTLVTICFQNKTELEYKDYYARELKFQDQIDANNNALALSAPIEYAVEQSSVLISIPKEINTKDLEGTIHFLRPSDASMDKTFVLDPDDSGSQLIKKGQLSSGVYKMRIACKSNSIEYFKEAIIKIK